MAAASSQQEAAPEQTERHPDTSYVCPMHPQAVSREPGRCPICGMDLVATTAEVPVADSLEHAAASDRAEPHAGPSYVCPMHPQAVSREPGRCPICGMDLVARKTDVPAADHAIHEAAMEIAPASDMPTVTVPEAVANELGVRTAEVRRGTLPRHIESFGSFIGSASRGYRPANRASDPGASDPGGSTSVLVAQVFERDAPLVHTGQSARVHFPGLSGQEWTGTVTGVETQISPTTRTLQFRVSVDLQGAFVPGGMTVLVTLEADPVADVLLVPREAVIATGKGARVILARGRGRFQPRGVTAEDIGEEEIVIRSGLQEGDRVVVSAQFLLDSEANLQAGLQRLTSEHPRSEAVSEGAMQ